MRELSLFSGAGGGLLGTKLLGWTHVGYVEYSEYCQKVIAQRIKDGILDEAPIFGDIRAFLSEGYAESYKGLVDVVTAGFPCQPFSVAGKRAAADDPRNMWPATMEVVRIIRPRLCYFENVPGLLSASMDDESTGLVQHYFGEILRDLAESGYSVRWRCLSAAEMGAPHKRDRLWIALADTSLYDGGHAQGIECTGKELNEPGERSTSLPNTGSIRQQGSWWAIEPCYTAEEEYREINRAFDGSRWAIKSPICRVANGVAHRVDRLKALGNGQVPAVVRAAWELLTQ